MIRRGKRPAASVPAFGSEWYRRNMYRLGSDEYKYHIATYGSPDKFGYKDFIPMLKAERFDAKVAQMVPDIHQNVIAGVFSQPPGFHENIVAPIVDVITDGEFKQFLPLIRKKKLQLVMRCVII